MTRIVYSAVNNITVLDSICLKPRFNLCFKAVRIIIRFIFDDINNYQRINEPKLAFILFSRTSVSMLLKE